MLHTGITIDTCVSKLLNQFGGTEKQQLEMRKTFASAEGRKDEGRACQQATRLLLRPTHNVRLPLTLQGC